MVMHDSLQALLVLLLLSCCLQGATGKVGAHGGPGKRGAPVSPAS